MTGYRKIWQESYARLQQEREGPPDAGEIRKFSQVYSYYLRGWLPPASNAPVLDIGCGAGLLLQFLKNQGFSQVQGLDSSLSQILLAKKLGLEVVQDSATAFLKNHASTFSLITALDFIEHLTRDEALEFLETAREALLPGGQIIVQTPNGESPWVGNVLYGDLTHEHCYTPHLLEKMFLCCGFDNIEYRPCGPAPLDFISMVRTLIWAGINIGCRVINRVEGAVSSGVYTRVFLIRAVRAR